MRLSFHGREESRRQQTTCHGYRDTQNAQVEFEVCNPPVTAVEPLGCSLFEILSLPSCQCCSTRTQLCSIFLFPLMYAERWGGIRCPFTTLFPKIQDLLRCICSCLCFPTSSRESCFILHTPSREKEKGRDFLSLFLSFHSMEKN